jgi:predicted transcriptional regulator
MNYEFAIRRLEAELAHVREMEAINRDHVEALDKGHEYTGNRLAAIEAALETLTADVTALTANINKLVDALLREHRNGHGDKNQN